MSPHVVFSRGYTNYSWSNIVNEMIMDGYKSTNRINNLIDFVATSTVHS